MLKIRSEQTRPFEAQAENAFIERVMEYLRKNHADAPVRLPKIESAAAGVSELTDKVLREMVIGGIARARNYGMTWKSTLISFVVLMFIVAPNFDEDGRVEKVLKNGQIPADERVEKLLDELSDEEWDAVGEKYDPAAWQLPSAAAAVGVEIVEEEIYERAT